MKTSIKKYIRCKYHVAIMKMCYRLMLMLAYMQHRLTNVVDYHSTKVDKLVNEED